MTASRIQDALRYRHAKDLYISECKNGPTQSLGARPIRLDGWAFLKTWSPVTSVGYEVKVSRSDFLNDHKWRDYLPLCHQFYFVAPKNLIALEELPAEVGLLEAIGGKDGGALRLVTRRKAVYMVPGEAYQDLLHYVLMARVRVGGEWVDRDRSTDPIEARRQRADEWSTWLRDKRALSEMGFKVSKRLQVEIEQMRVQTSAAKAKVEFYESTRHVLRQLGFDPDKPVSEWRLDKRIAEAAGIVTSELVDALQRARRELATVIEKCEAIKSRDVA